MKKYIIPSIFLLILIIGYIVVRTVDFSAITIGILERTANIDIEYEMIQGNIFRGYRIENYTVKLSKTDSIYGKVADIAYRFKPLSFKLPNLFEINLMQPTVHIKERTGEEEGRKFTLPHFNLGLRINIKNGTVIYENQKSYTIESISGLVFIDIVGSRVLLYTMNLSLASQEYPISITNAMLDLRMDSKEIEARSFKIKGNGISLIGTGTYSFEENKAILNLRKAEVDLQALKLYQGVVIFAGEIEYSNDRFLPKIKGSAKGLEPFKRFNFETNVFAETIWINVFDGELLGGSVFAQLKFLDLHDWGFEANFNDIDIGSVIKTQSPILISGFMGYKKNDFVGRIKLSAEYGLYIDSLFMFGSVKQSHVYLDSLIGFAPGKSLMANGILYPVFDLTMHFNEFDVKRFATYMPLEGDLMGTCRVQGAYENLLGTLFTSDITVSNFQIAGLNVKQFHIQSEDYCISDNSGCLNLALHNCAYKNRAIEDVNLDFENREFSIKATDRNDTLLMVGVFEKEWKGAISQLHLRYNGAEIKNLSPITFDLWNKKLDALELSCIGGILTGTLTPMNLQLSDGDLSELGTLLGLKDSISGGLDFFIQTRRFSLDAQRIDFMGLRHGSLKIDGTYTDKGIVVESLTVSDEKNQNIRLQGFFSLENSDLHVTFDNVEAWILPFLSNFLSRPKGILSGDISFKGNVEEFSFTGQGRIDNASFGIDAISAQFDSLTGSVVFDDDRIIFETARGKVSTMSRSGVSQTYSGEVQAGGVVKLDPRFGSKNQNFDISFRDAPIQYLPFAYGIGSGNFSVGMKAGTSYYNGNITVKQAIVPLEFGQEFKEEEAEGASNWTMNVKLKGDRNIWLRNRDADIEFGGELYIIKEEKGPLYLSGRFETRRGNYYWLNHVLTITSGQVTFIPEEELDGNLDFWAEMNTREGIKIILHFFGPMSEPVFEFFSEPPIYSEQDIITYLNLNITWKELESMKQEDYVGRVLPHSLISWLESDVSRRIRRGTGFDYFMIETPFFEPEGKTKLTVGKYISKDLFVTYTYDITSFQNEFNVEYFIDDKNEILIRKDEEGEYSLQYQYRIRF